MKILVSPAKKLDFENEITVGNTSTPAFENKTKKLAKVMRDYSAADLSKLMKLSQNLAQLNFERFQSFKTNFNTSLSKPAVFAFNGDTYTGLDIKSFNSKELNEAQEKLRILSGLYGLLKPLDLIQPYRLEMGTKLKFDGYKSLYDYWKEDITEQLNQETKKSELIVNCASQEYFGAVDEKSLKGQLVTPVFKENKNGELKIISFNAKRARGMMAAFLIKNKAKTIADIQKFNSDGYLFKPELSDSQQLVFTR